MLGQTVQKSLQHAAVGVEDGGIERWTWTCRHPGWVADNQWGSSLRKKICLNNFNLFGVTKSLHIIFGWCQRDVENLANYFGQYAPELQTTQYGKEIWAIYQRGELKPDTPLTGRFKQNEKKADVRSVMREITAAKDDHEAKLRYQQLKREEGR